MLVLAAPPGCGKTTIVQEIAKTDPMTMISVSATTRALRPGEVDGKHYYFVDRKKFQQMVDGGEMMEYALVYNSNMYGTPKAPVEKALKEGRDVLFDIDWQGNRKLSDIAKDDVVSIFLLPPSWAELERRLYDRAQDSREEITRRLGKVPDEISHYKDFQYVLVNTDLNKTIKQVYSILEAERIKRHRLSDLQDFVDTLKPLKK